MLGLKLNHVSKRGHWWKATPVVQNNFIVDKLIIGLMWITNIQACVIGFTKMKWNKRDGFGVEMDGFI